MKQSAKEIGAPKAIICEMAGKQTSSALKRFCQETGTPLKFLEEVTLWASKAKLYIELIEEAVRKDTKESDCPLAFGDYCVGCRARINNLVAKDLFTLHGTNARTVLMAIHLISASTRGTTGATSKNRNIVFSSTERR